MKKNLLYLLFISFAFQVKAQQELGLNLINDLPQANLTNPAYTNSALTTVCLPSLALNFANTGFSYRDLIRRSPQDDSLRLDMDHALGKMREHEYIFLNFNVNFLTVFHKVRKAQLSFYLAEKINVKLKYPKALPQFIWYGNSYFFQEAVNISPSVHAHKYREWAFGLSYPVKEGIQLGIRPKFIQGLADISTTKDRVEIFTDTASYFITAIADLELQTSNTDEFTQIFSPLATKRSSPGIALDIGGNWQINKKFRFAASLLDWGFIHWRYNNTSYESRGTYTFKGLDIYNFIINDSLSFTAYIDSLQDSFGITKKNEEYRTKLISKIYASGEYSVDSLSAVCLLLYGEFLDGFYPAFTAGYKRKFPGIFNSRSNLDVSAYYSYKNRSFYNLGLVAGIQRKRLQLFVAGDNLLSLLFPKVKIPLEKLHPVYPNKNDGRNVYMPLRLKNYNLRLGLNLLI